MPVLSLIFCPLFCAALAASLAFRIQESVPAVPAAESSPTVEREAASEIDAYLRRCVPFGFSGQVLVEMRGEVVLDGCYGWADRERGIPVTPDTAFGAASMTKPFVAAAILLLQQEGKLRVDTAASEYLSLPEEKRGILLSQLLTHTSGMPYSMASDDWEVTDPAELARRLRAAPLESTPGGRWEYSNAGYNLLVEVIEAVTGERYEDFVREHLLVPAGMQRSGFLHGAEPLAPPLALSYWRMRAEDDPRTWQPDAVLRGCGDLFTTAEDLRRWELALRKGAILDAHAVAELFQPRVPIQERVDYGFGWFHYQARDGIRHIEHGGDWKRGYNGLYRRYPEQGITLFLTSNQRLASGTWARAPLEDHLDERLLRGVALPMPPLTIPLDPSQLEAYAGEYGADPGARVRVRRDADTLRIEARGQHSAALLLGLSEGVESAGWAAAEGVESFLEQLVEDAEAVLTRALGSQPQARALFLTRWRAEIERIGRPSAITVLGGIPGPSGTTQVAAELRGPRGTAIALVYWSGEAFAGLDMDRSFTELERRFAPEAPARFVSYDLETELAQRIEFQLDPAGVVRGMRLPAMEPGTWLERVGE